MLTVTTAATTRRLTTPAALMSELALTDLSREAELLALIDQASAAVATWCDRTLATESVREVFQQTSRAECLVLARWPVIALDYVTISGTAQSLAEVEADESGSLYRLDADGNRIEWPSGRIVVAYSGGYSLPGEQGRTLPIDVERAAILLVKSAWFARGRDPMVKSEDIPGVISSTYWIGGLAGGATLPPDVEGLLSRHRSVAVG